MNTFHLSLDLDKSRWSPENLVTMRQGDKSGTTLVATIYDHGEQVSTTGLNARVVIPLPDHEHYYRKTATYAAGVCTVEIDETQAASVAGTVDNAYFQLLEGSSVIASTQCFTVHILPDALQDMELAEDYDSAIQEALDELDEATGRIAILVQEETDAWLASHPEITTTVQDNSVTDAKLIQSGGILDRVARLWHRLDNLLTNTPDEGDLVTESDAAKTPLVGASIFGRSTQSGTPTHSSPVAITSVTAAELHVAGANLYNPLCEDERTHVGVTWTPTAEGIRAVGTASSNSYLKGNATAVTDPDMTYIAAGTYTLVNHDGATLAAWLFNEDMTYTQFRTWGTSESTTFTVPEGGRYFRIGMRVASGATVNTTYRISLVVGSTATAFVPYQGSTLAIDLQGHELRSLPDGTRDELAVGADGHAVLTQRVGSADISASRWVITEDGRYRISGFSPLANMHSVYDNTYCTAYASTAVTSAAQPANTIHANSAGHQLFLGAGSTVVDCTFDYPLATPVTIDLGYVTLPTLPAPDLTAWAAQGATFELTYERDLNITLARLEAAIADAATA